MSTVSLVCAYWGCRRRFDKERGQHNRSVKRGMPEYCSRACFFDAKRQHGPAKPGWVRREDKAEYDRRRRAKLADRIRAEKAAYYQANKERLYAAHKARMDADPEYRAKYKAAQKRCQERPEWKAHKKAYDRRHRAVRDYGEYADAHVALMELGDAIEEAEPDWVALQSAKGTLNKKQTRRREWESKT